jgi:hypothetical protein
MEINTEKQPEIISGKEIDVSEEQVIQEFVPTSLFSHDDGGVMSISVTEKRCERESLLDVSSSSATGVNGKGVFHLTDFLCTSSVGLSFADPVSLVVTPHALTPCYATMTYTLLQNPNAPGSFNDLQITVFTWNAKGEPAPGIAFDWRCRLHSIPVIT